ncbi:GatB/YqeY domain-containing protein [Candidatus Falkowbacteria bacterium]|jgi:uncharacterized protein|nr:GatB/YqeY domain-containing protein [Candidatus Falkowbacteria bacterium]MBT5503627.1 GatB/YqeY domain-containing protein [Candidatus Falkowbacteria bacterium]MBT6574487.1 GatB/YqeY domain-containing protein [Candidatus Falkowbacteria bacterium]MBT7348111.1 GatB/YqeY domain-containing protein [Candidatus Falkowbacteria bacterium]MBT7500754.1 GatB/YqeY domain-containing protein [Candidatus Falkowbacteria bacterium]
MSLINNIEQALVQAMKDKNELVLSTLRMLKSAIKNKQIEIKKELQDEETIAILKSEIKKRKESAEMFGQAGRSELAERELSEIEVLQEYLPEQMSVEKIKEATQQVISQLPEDDKGNFGKVMRQVMTELQGQADGSAVSQVVKELLG